MASVSVKAEGKLFSGRPSRSVLKAAKSAQDKALASTRARTRVKTGNLKGAWQANISSASSGVSLAITNDVYYAKYQEYGTRYISPMGASKKGLSDAKSVFQQELQRELKNDLGGRIEYLAKGAIDAISIALGGSV